MSEFNQLRLMPGHLMIYHGSGVVITGLDGFVDDDTEGFYHRQTRFLSKFHATLGDDEPKMVSANAVSSYALIAYFLAPNPAGAKAGPAAVEKKDGGEIVNKGIELQINCFLAGSLRHEINLTNRALAMAEAVMRWEFAADFADMSKAEEARRKPPFPVAREWRKGARGGVLLFRCRHPELDHATEIRLEGEGRFEEDRKGAIVWTVSLRPQVSSRLQIEVLPVFCGERIAPFFVPGMDPPPTAAMRQPDLQLSAVGADYVRDAWNRAAIDLTSLALLDGEGVEKLMPAAGMPKYAAFFGRDVLVVGFQAGLFDRDMLRGTLRRVAQWKATEYDDRYDAEPGRVIHQRQLSPLALLGKNPFLHYYGDYSAPSWFLVDSALDLAITGDKEFYRSLREKILDTLAWMDRDGDHDQDGFYEYATKSEQGEKNQGWKDSAEAILYPDGQLVRDPIALVEIQAAYYAAKEATALAFAALGDTGGARRLLDEAEELKRRFNRAFWMPDEKYFAMALDPAKKQVATIASDPGQCLTWGILEGDKAVAVADRLMSPELFSGWGIRTLSKEHPAFNPFGYHLGSVWPAANALIGFGLKRYGFNAHLHRLAKAQLEATRLFELDRLPEVFGGHDRDREHLHPGIYPETNAPQAWSAGAVISLVQTMLGLFPLAPLQTLVVDPDLPDWLPELTLSGIRVGDARVALRFRRQENGATDCEIVSQEGELRLHRSVAAPPGTDRIARTVRELIGQC